MSDTTTTDPTKTNPVGSDLTAIYDFIKGVTGGNTSDANKVADAADPYRGQRSQWFDPLKNLVNDPSSIFKDPAFNASLNLGLEGVSRQAGAAGMSASGNRLADLEKYGQTQASSFYNTRLTQLMKLAGVDSGSPAAAAQAIQQGQGNRDSGIGAGITAIDSILKQVFPQGVPAAISALVKKIFPGSGVDAVGGVGGDQSGGADLGGYNDLAPGGVDSVGGIGGDQSGGADLGGFSDLAPPPDMGFTDPGFDWGSLDTIGGGFGP
ncbi:MAG: hypothetical protein ACREO5_00095 [Candidatus Binatia bacterium]